ncbi:MAG: Snf7 family protein [Candidatus Methanosuratincola sp.]
MLKNFFRRTPPLKDALNEAIIALGRQKRKLEIIDAKLKARRNEIFKLCTSALKNKSSERAKIYANEIAEIKKIQEKVSNGILLLEQLTLRMETLREVGSTFAQLEPTLEVVKQVSDQLSEIIPDVSGELMQIGSCLNSVMAEMRIPLSDVETAAISDTAESEEVLDEVSAFIRGRLIERLPEPPKEIGFAAPVHFGAEGRLTKSVSHMPVGSTKDEEEVLMEHLERNEGVLDFRELSSKFGMNERQVTRLIESLSKKGLIRIMTASEAIASDGDQ